MYEYIYIISFFVISTFILFYLNYNKRCSYYSNSNNIIRSEQNILIESLLQTRENYIELMKKIILNSIYEDGPWITDGSTFPKGKALTMIGTRRLNNLQMLIKTVIKDNITGDIIEAGCWRGGAMMFARTILNAYNQMNRSVFMCDSFSGIPQMEDSKYAQDKAAHTLGILNYNPVENVYAMLKKLNLENGTIVVKGYFNETLHKIHAKSFSIIRLDGDTYISTIQSISALYPKLSVGGYIIIDDYLGWISCKQAITDYRKQHNIDEEIIEVFHEKGEWKIGVYWKKIKQIEI